MQYPITQYRSSEQGSTSTFKGLNRTDKGSGGEWLDENDLDTEHYPCLAPRHTHGAELALNPSDTSVIGRICAAAPPITDSGEYNGFTGVLLYDNCINSDGSTEKNYCFVFNGEIKHVGPEPEKADEAPPPRTSLWEYNTSDDVSDDEVADFKANIHRVIWSIAAVGRKYVINGYDPTLKRGKYFTYNTKPAYEENVWKREIVRTVIPAESQYTYSKLSFYTTNKDGTILCYITNRDKDNRLSDRFTEGDYIIIRGSKYDNDIHPYAEHGYKKKYAVVKEIIVNESDSNFYEDMYYYATTPHGKYRGNHRCDETNITIGVFVPPMKHITSFGKRVWGVNPEEDSVCASVFDTPLKMINTDAQLDNAMSWQAVLGTADEVVGVVPAVTEMLVMKKNSLMRITGTSASSFTVAGMYRNCGCIDIRSCAEAAGTVIYLGYNGFYAYTGAQPQIISRNLNCAYSSAVGFTDGMKYYASAIRADNGIHEFLTYDIRSGTWHKWSDTPIAAAGLRIGSNMYVYSNSIGGEGSVIELCSGSAAHPWECESVVHYEGVNTSKAVNELWIRCITDKDVYIYTCVNSGEWKKHKPLVPKGRVFMYKVPVRLSPGDYWQYRLSGTGMTVIYNIERIYEEGGGRHYAH